MQDQAANQILFGHKAAVKPVFQGSYLENSDKFSHDGFSQNGDNYLSSRGEMHHNMYSSYTSRVMQDSSYNQNHKFIKDKFSGLDDVSFLNSLSQQKSKF